jgi:CRP-like cAMP-binding protein
MADISAQVKDFFSQYPQHTFDRGQIIIAAGEEPPGIMFIAEGRVSKYDISPAGNEVVVNVFKPGAFFPMSWAINQTPNEYFYEASLKTVVYQAPSAAVVQFLHDNPDVTYDLLSRVYNGIEGILRRMAHLMGGDANSRLLFELLIATSRFGEQRPDGSVFVTMKEHDLARNAGMARETVNRAMQRIKATGLVTIDRSGIIVHDAEKLSALLGTKL